MNHPSITMCGHCFCRKCIREVLKTQSSCPLCRTEIKENEVMELPPDESNNKETSDDIRNDNEMGERSSKVDAVMRFLYTAIKRDKTNKIVVFSQWAKALDILEPFLKSVTIYILCLFTLFVSTIFFSYILSKGTVLLISFSFLCFV